MPARIIPKELLTEVALAWVVTSKYQYSLPLYRQTALLGRFVGDLSRNKLAASVVRVGQAVQRQSLFAHRDVQGEWNRSVLLSRGTVPANSSGEIGRRL